MEKNSNEAYDKVMDFFGPPVYKKVLVEKIPFPNTVLKRGKFLRKFWMNEYGELHSKHGNPAEIKQTGTEVWYKNGKRHRDNDMPAEIVYEGSRTMIWAKNGVICREGLKPAMITTSNVYWYGNGIQIVQYSINEVALRISNQQKLDKMMSLVRKRKEETGETYNDAEQRGYVV